MGVRPAHGRAFLADEDQAGRPVPVVVLDHDEWARSFGSNPGVIGSTIRHRRHGLLGDRRGPAWLHWHRPRRAPRLLRAAGHVDQRAAGAAAGRADDARGAGATAGGESTAQARPDLGSGARRRRANRHQPDAGLPRHQPGPRLHGPHAARRLHLETERRRWGDCRAADGAGARGAARGVRQRRRTAGRAAHRHGLATSPCASPSVPGARKWYAGCWSRA